MSGAYGYDIIWLVVEPYTSEKWWNSSVGMMTFPIWWKNIKGSKPPTSDIYIYIYLYVYGWLWMYMGYSGNDAIILSKKTTTTKSMQPVSFCINWWSDRKIISWSPSHLVFPGSLDWHQFDSGPLHVSLGQGDTCRWPSRGLPKGLKMGPLYQSYKFPSGSLW